MEIALVQIVIAAILTLFPQIPAGVSSFITSVIAQLPVLVASGTDINAFVNAQVALVKEMIAANRDPTQQEWDDLNGTVAAELAKLQAQAAPTP